MSMCDTSRLCLLLMHRDNELYIPLPCSANIRPRGKFIMALYREVALKPIAPEHKK